MIKGVAVQVQGRLLGWNLSFKLPCQVKVDVTLLNIYHHGNIRYKLKLKYIVICIHTHTHTHTHTLTEKGSSCSLPELASAP